MGIVFQGTLYYYGVVVRTLTVLRCSTLRPALTPVRSLPRPLPLPSPSQTYADASALYAISLISPTLIASFGTYTRAESQLMTLPIYISACLFVLVSSILADRQKKRFIYMMVDLVLTAAGLIINCTSRPPLGPGKPADLSSCTSVTPAPTGVKYFGLCLTAMGAYGGLPTVRSLTFPVVFASR